MNRICPKISKLNFNYGHVYSRQSWRLVSIYSNKQPTFIFQANRIGLANTTKISRALQFGEMRFFSSDIGLRTKHFGKKLVNYLSGLILTFVIVYSITYYSVTTILYEFLKIQSNSIPVKQNDDEISQRKK